jgi:uncharacterized RDD family membrane protein YckC
MPENTVFCSKCGAQNAAQAVFCQSCGGSMGIGVPAVTVAAPAVAYAPPAQAAYSPYGGFWLRVVAALLDGVIVGAVTVPLGIIFLLPSILRIIQATKANQEPSIEWFGPFFLIIPLILLGVWLYDALLTCSSWQGTVGKRALRLKVTDLSGNKVSFGRATGRFFAKLLFRMLLTVFIYLVVAFTERKQGLHDLVAGTLVMKF